MQEPLERVKEIIQSIGQLDHRGKTQFTISTKEPHLIELLIAEMNKRASSDEVYIKREGITELRSADRTLYQYRIVAKSDIKRDAYETAVDLFKRSLPHIADNFLMVHKRRG